MNSNHKAILSERRWIPDGFHFLGPEESRNRRKLLLGLIRFFEESDYTEVTLPAFDYTSSFQSQINGLDASALLSAKDYDGYLLSPGIDLTLQVVKGMAARSHWAENQNVYYIGRKIRDHKKRNASRREILQIGGECIGKSDHNQVLSQVLLLEKLWEHALPNVSGTFVLGHAGILTSIFEILGWEGDDKVNLAQFLYTKNSAELIRLAKKNETNPTLIQLLELFLKPIAFSDFADFKEKCIQLGKKSSFGVSLETYLLEVSEFIGLWTKSNLHFAGIWDPSLVRDVDYYSGLVFQGYMDGYSEPVFAGGVYNFLYESYTEIKKEACGFALHIDPIEEMINSKK